MTIGSRPIEIVRTTPFGAVVRRLRLMSDPAPGDAASAGLRAGLEALQHRVDAPNVFHDLDALYAATHLVGPIDLYWLERGAVIVAALPVTRRRLGFGLAGALPHGLAHDFGPAGTPLIDPDVAVADLGVLLDAARGGASALVLPFVEADSAAVEAVVAAAAKAGSPLSWLSTHGRAGLTARPDGSIDPLPAISAGRRKEWARLERRLMDIGHIEHRRDTAPEAVAAAFADIMALEARGWKGRRATALASHAPGRAFSEATVTALARRGAVVIDRLMSGERSIAGLISFRLAGRLWIWKTAYDEDFARYSPGVQLMLKVTQRVAEDGTIRSADSLATPDHPMIDAIWPERLVMTTLVMAAPGSGIGRRLERELALYEKARALARRVLGR